MKTIKLEGEALIIAELFSERQAHHKALHEAWEQKINREHERLQEASDGELKGIVTRLMEMLPIPAKHAGKASLDLRYLEEHGFAAVYFPDASDDEPLHEAPSAEQ